MGARIEGKTKKKSIKANVTSKFGSKRKASRMGKKVKKGEMGPNTEFVTRSAAIKKLQITLKDFRRLCILKGVYPRVPEKAPKGADKVYYDIKDISFIMHEPLLEKFREFKSFMKKIRKASGRNQYNEARRKNDLRPVMALDHLVKERYPRFIDALRDLDDALCMVHLFAALPSTGRITSNHTHTCCELSRHWQYYVAKSRCLQKVFVSVKGVYFQIEAMGESINWLVPHKFTQLLPKEVDIRVMLTFLEFYEVFLKFVLFKLYAMQNLQYPPKVDNRLDEAGCFLLAVKASPLTEGNEESNLSNQEPSESKPEVSLAVTTTTSVSSTALATLPTLFETLKASQVDEDDDEAVGFLAAPLEAALFAGSNNTLSAAASSLEQDGGDDGDEEERLRTFALPTDSALHGRLFVGLRFFINREVPLDWFQLCVTAFGGKVGWEGPLSPYEVTDECITHQIVDRPLQGVQSKSREYVQPQWVLDCINAKLLLPVQNYLPGAKLPPHLSPFVDDDKEGYLPRYREEIKRLVDPNGEQTAVAVGDKKSNKNNNKNKGAAVEAVSEEDEDEDDDDDEEAEEEEEGDEDVEEEVEAPKKTTKQTPAKKGAKPNKKQIEDEEAVELSKMMMNKKSKRLYGRMQHGIQKKQSAVAALEEKRRSIESGNSTKKIRKS